MVKVKTVHHGQETRGTKPKAVSTHDPLAGKLTRAFNKAIKSAKTFKGFIK